MIYTFCGDINILLEFPTGVNFLILSDALMHGTGFINANITLDDSAATYFQSVVSFLLVLISILIVLMLLDNSFPASAVQNRPDSVGAA